MSRILSTKESKNFLINCLELIEIGNAGINRVNQKEKMAEEEVEKYREYVRNVLSELNNLEKWAQLCIPFHKA